MRSNLRQTAPQFAQNLIFVQRNVLRHRLLQVLVDLVEEALGRKPFLVGADKKRKVLGHEPSLDSVDADLLERGSELGKRFVAVELGAMRKTACPGEDR